MDWSTTRLVLQIVAGFAGAYLAATDLHEFSVLEAGQRDSRISGFPEAAERASSLAFDLTFAASLCESTIRRHEPSQHRRDQF
jgi:hypothetical protein